MENFENIIEYYNFKFNKKYVITNMRCSFKIKKYYENFDLLMDFKS